MESHISTASAAISALVPLVLVAASYIFFIIASLAVARSRTSRVEELVDGGNLGARRALLLLDRPNNYLLCSQVGRFLSSVGAGLILASLMRQVPDILEEAGASGGGVYGPLVSLFILTTFVGVTLILVQIAKTISLQFPEHCLCAVALPLGAAYTIFGPVVVFVHSAVSKVLARWNLKASSERDLAVSTDDISELVRRGSEAGEIEESEKELLESVVELSERIVREVMTPRKEIVFVRESASTVEVVEVLMRERVSRLLVCGVELDDVKGVVLGKDMLRFVGKSVTPAAWRDYVRPVNFVPLTKQVDDLLIELRQKGTHIAVVLDEHGGVDGIVTLEDLIEEIVGDIVDEFDHPSEQQLIVRDESGALTMDAAVKLSRLSDEFGVELPEGDYDTVAGFILSHLGHLPDPGERVVSGDAELLVQTIDQNRIGRVVLRVISGQSMEVLDGLEKTERDAVLAETPAPRISQAS